MKQSAIIITISLLTGCATTLSDKALSVQLADTNMVKECQLLNTVEGSSTVSGLMISQGIQNARNEAIEKAAELGATHIVITNSIGGSSPYVSGNAYKCN
ncbi:MAG: DUF4156 domain-containing protein [Gammaproteobacteria bacterium]|nr:DUF4156 domain-containing protein [Gammaproteobacteria bacterium]